MRITCLAITPLRARQDLPYRKDRTVVSSSTRAFKRSSSALAALAGAALLLTACSSGSGGGDATASDDATTAAEESTSEEAAAEEGEWPRIIEHASGETEIPEQPLVIVSTSITLTGTLLAIDAPVAASAATSVGPLTDDNGFFAQWADVATERGVEVLYPNLELDLEAIEALEPDLIIGSIVGADSTVDSYDQLAEIAPTVMLDYGASAWEDLAVVLGEATGLEADAAAVIDEFDAYLAESAAAITLPEQPVSALAYNGADGGGIFSATSPQASILTSLGFTYVAGPDELADTVRSDVSFFTAENLPTALGEAKVAFVVSGGDEDAAALLADPLLANTPSVSAGNVLPLGPTSFRIDFYSGTQMVEVLLAEYGN